MSTNINTNEFRTWLFKQVRNDLTANEAKKFGVEKEFEAAVEDLDVNSLDLDDVIKDTDLYEQFATLYTNEKDSKAQAKDKEQEKEEQTQIKDKNGAGV